MFQWVKRYIEPSSSVGGRLINERRETRFKERIEIKRLKLKKGGYHLKRKILIIAMIFLSTLIIISGCSEDNSNKSSADWAFSFVV